MLVYLFVRQQNYTKLLILTNFGGKVAPEPLKKPPGFGGNGSRYVWARVGVALGGDKLAAHHCYMYFSGYVATYEFDSG